MSETTSELGQAGSGGADGQVVIPDRLFFKIGDVADMLKLKPYVLRFWESEFPMISPQKSNSGQRMYRRSDVETILMIKRLLYGERYSIEGAKRRIREMRKEGDLKAYKQHTVQAQVSQPDPREKELEEQREERAMRLRQIARVARELQGMAKVPLPQLFKAVVHRLPSA